MAVYQQSSQENVIYNINISNCNIETLFIGDGNTVNTSSCRRRLDYPVQRTDSSSGTATQDGEWTGTKRKQTKIRFPQRKHRANPNFPLELFQATAKKILVTEQKFSELFRGKADLKSR